MSGPRQRYEAGLTSEEYQVDAAQKQAIVLLQSLYEELCETESGKSGFLDLFFVSKPSVIKGLYFWGGVGLRKS